MRMPRIQTYYDKTGHAYLNTGRLLIPFRLMENTGDWCEVQAGKFCLAGNVAAICSAYGIKMGVRFEFRDMKNGVFKITNVGPRVELKRKTSRVTARGTR